MGASASKFGLQLGVDMIGNVGGHYLPAQPSIRGFFVPQPGLYGAATTPPCCSITLNWGIKLQ